MPGLVAISMEDVLLSEDPKSYAASVPIPEGVALAQLLLGAGPVAFLTAAGSEEKASYWLKVNNLGTGRLVAGLPQDRDLDRSGLQRAQVSRLRASGGLWLVVTALPEVGLWCFQRGQAAVVFLQPTYRSSGPETEAKSWSELAAATQRARELAGEPESPPDVIYD